MEGWGYLQPESQPPQETRPPPSPTPAPAAVLDDQALPGVVGRARLRIYPWACYGWIWAKWGLTKAKQAQRLVMHYMSDNYLLLLNEINGVQKPTDI